MPKEKRHLDGGPLMPVSDPGEELHTAERDMQSECWTCQHRREVPGNSHIRCAKPDPDMTGHEHGIRRGWFSYPLLFDPTWKTRLCANHEERAA